MTFNSLTFIAFFAIVALLHRLPFSWHTKKVNLLVASYVFYAAWNRHSSCCCGPRRSSTGRSRTG